MDSEEEDDVPILPPSFGQNHNMKRNRAQSSTSTSISTKSNGRATKSNSSKTAHHHAVRNVIDRLASAKEHINRTVLKPVAEFNSRPCINMKDFFAHALTEKSKRQQNLDALYNLVEHDSDSIAGFVELNGLSFIDEWLDLARKDSDDWLALCILQFLAHQNLCITYEALQNAPIAKTVKYYMAGAASSSSDALHSVVASDSQCMPRLTDQIRAVLPSDLSVARGSDNFLHKIDRDVLHKVCKEVHDVDAIRYLQSQFASRIVIKWKKFVADWKKSNNRPNYRHIKFADEKAKPLVACTVFSRDDIPKNITDEQDKKRREKMCATVKWKTPRRMRVETVMDMDGKPLEGGRGSTEKKTQKDREAAELEEYSIGNEHLKEPKSLASNRASASVDNRKMLHIPLDSLQSSPSPDKNEISDAAMASHKQAAAAAVPSQQSTLHYAPHTVPHSGAPYHDYSGQYHPPPPHSYHHAYGHAHGLPPPHAYPSAHHPHAHPPHNPYATNPAPPPPGVQHGYGMHAPPPPHQHAGYPGGMMQQPPPQPGYHHHAVQQPPPDVIMTDAHAAAAAGAADNSTSMLANGKRGRTKREFSDAPRPAKRQKLGFDEFENDRDYRRKVRTKEKHEKRRKRDRAGMRRGANVNDTGMLYTHEASSSLLFVPPPLPSHEDQMRQHHFSFSASQLSSPSMTNAWSGDWSGDNNAFVRTDLVQRGGSPNDHAQRDGALVIASMITAIFCYFLFGGGHYG